jgi:hypothetical protein
VEKDEKHTQTQQWRKITILETTCSSRALTLVDGVGVIARITRYFVKAGDPIESNQIESNTIESNQIESNLVESNTIESNQIESNLVESNTTGQIPS